MKFKRPDWNQFLPVVKQTFWRFPLPGISTVLTTLFALLLIHEFKSVDQALVGKGIATTIYATIVLTSLKLLTESASWHLRRYLVAASIVLVVISNYVWEFLSEATTTTHVFFALAITLSLLFAPYLSRQSNQASVWYFNYQTGVAIFFGGLAAILLGTSLSIILASIRYLFEVKIPEEFYGDVWVISFGLLFPLYVLANLSREFDFADEGCQFPRGIRFIANYILAPVMLFYMAILYAYFGKIILQWELPRGNLGWMITSFGTVGIVTKLLAYPIRSDGTRMLLLFDRYYYHALFVPIGLLAVAIGVRINEYGFTEQRYAVVLLGFWFFIVALMTTLRKERFHIKWIPVILAVLALLASFGPWGAVTVSINSQANRFEAILAEHQLIENGFAVKATLPVSFEDRKAISSSADYLTRSSQRMHRIDPLFKNLLLTKSLEKLDSKPANRSKKLVELLGLEYVRKWQKESFLENFNYNLRSDPTRSPIKISGFDYIGHSVSGYSRNKSKKEFNLDHNGSASSISVTRRDSQITVTTDTGQEVVFDLALLIQKIRADENPQPQLTFENNSILTRTSSDGKLRVRILLQQLRGEISSDGVPKFSHVGYQFMIDFVD